MIKASLQGESKNLCTWELSPDGASEFNKAYITNTDVYYFSFSTYATKSVKNGNNHRPDSFMSLHLFATSILIGNDDNVPDSTWYENDGICNTVSMTHPSGSQFIIYDGIPHKGIWQSMGKIHMDHQTVIGHLVSKKEIDNIIVLYNNHAKLLYSLQ